MTHQYITQREKEENERLFKAKEQAKANLQAFLVIYPLETQTPEQMAVYQALSLELSQATARWHQATNNYFFA
jgi:hypothetical protein